MGQVFLAEQLSLGKKVAIKVLHPHLQGNPDVARRFQREAKAASLLNHPNSLQIIDFGQSAQGELYIAMELLEGRSLAGVIQAEFPFPLERIVRIVSQVLSALDEAHTRGVIHRDLKPENIMIADRLRERDFVKVCDFGIAKVQEAERSEGPALTMNGAVCGTPEFMSPEQCRGEPLDGRSDLYAVAVILYRMATGTLPFTADTAIGVISQHLTVPARPPKQVRSDVAVDARLEALIMRGLEKSPALRPPSASAMKAELDALVAPGAVARPRVPAVLASAQTLAPEAGVRAREEPATAVEYGLGSLQTSTATGTREGATAAEIAALPRARRRMVWGIVAVALAAAGAAAVAAVSRQGAPAAQHPSAPPQAPPPPSPSPQVAATPPPPSPSPQVVATPPPPSPSPRVLAPGPNLPPSLEPTESLTHRKPQWKSAPIATRGRPATPTTHAPAPTAPASAATPTTHAPAPTPPASAAAPQLSPAQVAFSQAGTLFGEGKLREAITKYQEVVALDHNFAEAYRELGRAYSRLPDETENRNKNFRKYLELRPNAKDAVFYNAILNGP
jgi:serine/threonine-protein kinase